MISVAMGNPDDDHGRKTIIARKEINNPGKDLHIHVCVHEIDDRKALSRIAVGLW